MSEVDTELVYRRASVSGREVGVTSYRVGRRFACRVDNIDPGTIIGRGMAPTREVAERTALGMAAMSVELGQASQALRNSVSQLQQKPQKR